MKDDKVLDKKGLSLFDLLSCFYLTNHDKTELMCLEFDNSVGTLR